MVDSNYNKFTILNISFMQELLYIERIYRERGYLDERKVFPIL
ncbi:MAG: hypothetical protein ACOCRU_03065 [bacterium]